MKVNSRHSRTHRHVWDTFSEQSIDVHLVMMREQYHTMDNSSHVRMISISPFLSGFIVQYIMDIVISLGA